MAIPGSQHTISLDTLIVAISEGSDTDCVAVAGANLLEVDENRMSIRADAETLATNRPGVFAGGDVVTGPNTVVNAIAAGRRAAIMIDRYLRDELLVQDDEVLRPSAYVEPPKTELQGSYETPRVNLPRLDAEARRQNFLEVERALSKGDALREARRCLRCDLEFALRKEDQKPMAALEEVER